MKYIVFPVEKLNEVSQEVLDELYLVPRKSVDGTEVIMKVDNYERLFPSVQTLLAPEDEEVQVVVYPYPIYEGDSLDNLLDSSEWSADESPSVLSSTNVLDDSNVNHTSVKLRKSYKSTVL